MYSAVIEGNVVYTGSLEECTQYLEDNYTYIDFTGTRRFKTADCGIREN